MWNKWEREKMEAILSLLVAEGVISLGDLGAKEPENEETEKEEPKEIIVETVTNLLSQIYLGLIEKGFDKTQAFDITKEIITKGVQR